MKRLLERLFDEFPAIAFLLVNAILYALKKEFYVSALYAGAIAHLLSKSVTRGRQIAELRAQVNKLTDLANMQTQINNKSVEAISVWAAHVQRGAGKLRN